MIIRREWNDQKNISPLSVYDSSVADADADADDNRHNFGYSCNGRSNAHCNEYSVPIPLMMMIPAAASSTTLITQNGYGYGYGCSAIRSIHSLCRTNISNATLIHTTDRITNVRRYFSSRSNNRNRNRNNNNRNRNNNSSNNNNRNQKDQGPLINEHVIRAILESKSESVEDIQVRLLVDTRAKGHKSQGEEEGGGGNKDQDQPSSTVQVVSLAEAISIATDLDVDLVGVSLQQSTPVVRAINYSKFVYQQSSSSTKSKSNKNNNNQSPQKKEFTFRAGIDTNDLQRKVNNMVSYLQKGYSCNVVITSNRRNLMQDDNVLVTMLGRIEDLVGEHGKAQGQMKKNGYGNRGNLMFQPSSTKK
eukprot:CAMPEP_0203670740 /NCGR_PEP_ID=MMETSP0090-20130426/6725_1 /ASSEMBLY_ACC=CAM_ASM_001088 /TAXON_ID=426623 /ORGANISM="Chaetoceros affinis, Strain CCMP159" /LENGTH=360 /DNA_ID=CAMNT_0050535665 /DNA_START=371 /DNA_END=1453 /DNA_ORIENTATION=+